MIFNSTYTDKEKELEVNEMVGSRFGFISSIRLNGVGSKRLIIEEVSPNFKNIIKQKNDIIYSNIEIRKDGILVYIAEGLKRFTWVIPYYKLVVYKTPNFSIHCDGNFIRFSNDLNKKENIRFFKKIIDHKLNYAKTQNYI